MTVYVTAITPASAQQHPHIGGVRWLDSDKSISKTMSTAEAVDWLQKGHKLYVAGETGAVEVRIVDANPPYLRTVANGSYTDNLLYLPRY
jgi:Protein of unknown function (DUF3892)